MHIAILVHPLNAFCIPSACGMALLLPLLTFSCASATENGSRIGDCSACYTKKTDGSKLVSEPIHSRVIGIAKTWLTPRLRFGDYFSLHG